MAETEQRDREANEPIFPTSFEQTDEGLDWPEDSPYFDFAPIAQPRQRKAGEVPDSELSPEEVLERYWAYPTFRPLQREIVLSALEGRNTLGLLPTGGGKSVCFQVPGLMLPGITLVITPLIALMKDQVDHLRSRGIKATAIHSGMSAREISQTIDNCLYGRYKFLYISPERLASERFRTQLEVLEVSLLVIDECHCICQWGYDFRPSYLNILDLRAILPAVPILALTATATPPVAQEIKRILGFGEGDRLYQKSFIRPNLSYAIRKTEDKEAMLLHILSRVAGTAIVYCRSRELCRAISSFLKANGHSATYFHAGLTHTERAMRQERWMRGEVRIMVATNAFGMGIDKPDVRLVIHLMIPSSLEEYYQEAGRAGRDGKLSYAVALVSPSDTSLLRRRVSDSFPPLDYIYQSYEALCNYLSIGEGEGYGRSFDFEYEQFVRLYRLRPIQTRSAIEIMALSGWLDLYEDGTRSRLQFLYTRQELYQPHVGFDKLLRAILRLYTGVFSDYVFIQEQDIAEVTGYSAEEVYGILTKLNQMGVLHYIPRKSIPRIVFKIRREDSRHLHILPSAYHDRLQRFVERIEATEHYITDENTCRTRLLIGYFGERSNYACGQCDVCLKRTDQGLQHYVIEDTQRAIQQILTEQKELRHLSLSALCQALPYTTDDVLGAVDYLLSEGLNEGWKLTGGQIECLSL